ncbi:hypothetical protein JXR93_09295 [bacterium]|nr:hypothetical protein [bacterium]
MDITYYKHLLRRLFFFPITFSRNKFSKLYQSEEGNLAVKRVKILRRIKECFEHKEAYIDYCKYLKDEEKIEISIKIPQMSLENRLFITTYEWQLLNELPSCKKELKKFESEVFNG